ncbi:MAG: uracil phosphoribosyltransferase [Metamycoplasmataceae bacterium]
MIKIINHPLIDIKLTVLRDKNTNHIDFKKNLNEIASLMVYEILRDYKTKIKEVETPNSIVFSGSDFDKEIIIVPILRAGLGMVDGIHSLIPQARIGHIGLYRDEETLEIKEYFYKMPDSSKNAQIILVDPMLATGSSATEAISKLKETGFKNIILVSLVGTEKGINKVSKIHKNVSIYLAAKDNKLNEKGFIIPGLGDAGDRIFGTK